MSVFKGDVAEEGVVGEKLEQTHLVLLNMAEIPKWQAGLKHQRLALQIRNPSEGWTCKQKNPKIKMYSSSITLTSTQNIFYFPDKWCFSMRKILSYAGFRSFYLCLGRSTAKLYFFKTFHERFGQNRDRWKD